MRPVLFLIACLATPLSAQLVIMQGQPLPGSPLYRAPVEATSSYVAAGQDEPGYRAWYAADPERPGRVRALNDYLATYEVAGIVPTWQLLRTATLWRVCGAQPFEVPPSAEWPNVVQTLRYVRDYVVPAVGAVEPVSAYRNPALNRCAGGAIESAHQKFHAMDLVPLRPTTREELMSALCAAHLRRGSDYSIGLGFYAFLRFHVDSTRFRKWGTGGADAASPCRVAITPVAAAPPQTPPAETSPPASDPVPETPLDPLAPR